MIPTHQRLRTHDCAGFSIAFGLQVEAEFVVVKRLVDVVKRESGYDFVVAGRPARGFQPRACGNIELLPMILTVVLYQRHVFDTLNGANALGERHVLIITEYFNRHFRAFAHAWFWI